MTCFQTGSRLSVDSMSCAKRPHRIGRRSDVFACDRIPGTPRLRAGMEIAAPTLGYYSRDLLP